MSTGETSLVDVPVPKYDQTSVLIQTTNSLISIGTERILVESGKASLIEKAKKQTEKVKQVIQKIKTDGLFTTFDSVKAKLSEPITLGYSLGCLICVQQVFQRILILNKYWKGILPFPITIVIYRYTIYCKKEFSWVFLREG